MEEHTYIDDLKKINRKKKLKEKNHTEYFIFWIYISVPSQPRNIRHEVTGPNTIDVSWEPPSQTRNPVKEYWVYYNDTYLKQENKAVVPGTQTKYQLQDLTPNTVYSIKVSALSEKGEGAATRIIMATTEDFGMFFCHTLYILWITGIDSRLWYGFFFIPCTRLKKNYWYTWFDQEMKGPKARLLGFLQSRETTFFLHCFTCSTCGIFP